MQLSKAGCLVTRDGVVFWCIFFPNTFPFGLSKILGFSWATFFLLFHFVCPALLLSRKLCPRGNTQMSTNPRLKLSFLRGLCNQIHVFHKVVIFLAESWMIETVSILLPRKNKWTNNHHHHKASTVSGLSGKASWYRYYFIFLDHLIILDTLWASPILSIRLQCLLFKKAI